MDSETMSVRPKIRTKQLEKAIEEPLEKKTIRFVDRDGIERCYPALDSKFSYSMEFIKYLPPPFPAIIDLKMRGQDIDNNVLVIKWKENTKSFEEIVKTLLRLQYNQFWSTIVFEKSLQVCLESYLRFAPRDYDCNSYLYTDSMKMQIRRIHNLIFKLYNRICSSVESQTNFISESTFGKLLYENHIIDVQKISDLSVIFLNTSFHPSLSRLLSNIVQYQPKYEDDLHKWFADVCNELNNLRSKFGTDDNKLDENDKLSHLQWHELQSLVSLIADIAIRIGALLQTLPQTAQLFRIVLLDKTVVEFYNKVFPSLQNELNSRFSIITNDLIIQQIRRQVMIARSYMIFAFRKVIENCFLNQLMEEISQDLKLCLIDEFIECLTSAAFERSFIYDYCCNYPLDSDMSKLSKHSECTQFDKFDKTRITYLKNIIQSSVSSNVKQQNQNSVKSEEIKSNGFIETEEFDENEVELESSVQYIREIMPELGPGFITLCLQHFNYDNEKTLNAILEDNLPQHLANIDRSLDKVKRSDNKNSKKEVNSSDHNCSVKSVEPVPQVIDNRQNIYNNDEFDIFRNEKVDLTRIHLGKKEKSVSNLRDDDKEKIMAFHYRQLDEEENQTIDYNDEYDDTYEDDNQIDLMADKCVDELDTNRNNSADNADNEEPNENNNETNREQNRDNRDHRSGKEYNQRYNRGRSRHYRYKNYK